MAAPIKQEPPTSTFNTAQPRRKWPLGIWPALSLLLVIALAVCICLWKPWQANIKATDRTVSVTGSATITATPDEFVFTPSYNFVSADKQTAISQLTTQSDQIVTKLKALGVPSSKIKTDANDYNNYYSLDSAGNSTYALSLTVTVDDQTLSQKVQDYLLTTDPTGSISPQASFSTAKQKTLEAQARDKAEQDARALADQSAKNLGFKIDKVKTVTDNGFGGSTGCGGGLCASPLELSGGAASTTQLSVQPGQNDLMYSVNVTYYIH